MLKTQITSLKVICKNMKEFALCQLMIFKRLNVLDNYYNYIFLD